MKGKRIDVPETRENSLQGVIDFLIDNGLSEFNTNSLIHTDLVQFGGYRNMVDVARDGEWDLLWNVATMYINGDLT